MEARTIETGSLVQWDTDERSFEGKVVGQRTLAGGRVLVHVEYQSPFFADVDRQVAIDIDDVRIIG